MWNPKKGDYENSLFEPCSVISYGNQLRYFYHVRFTSNPRKWIKENRDTNYSIRRVFNYDVKQGDKIVWHGSENGGHSIDQIKKIMKRNDILYTEYTAIKNKRIDF